MTIRLLYQLLVMAAQMKQILTDYRRLQIKKAIKNPFLSAQSVSSAGYLFNPLSRPSYKKAALNLKLNFISCYIFTWRHLKLLPKTSPEILQIIKSNNINNLCNGILIL